MGPSRNAGEVISAVGSSTTTVRVSDLVVILPRDPSVYDAKRCKRFLPMYIGLLDFQLFDISSSSPARDSEGLVPFTGKLSKMQFILCKAKS